MRVWLAALALLFACARTSPPERAVDPMSGPVEQAEVSREALVSDLQHAYAELRASHYDLYAHVDATDYDALLARLVEQARPCSRRGAAAMLTELVAFGQIGHARVDFPVAEYIDYVRQGGTVFPADVEVRDGSVVVAHSYTEQLQPGDVLVAMDGRAMATWLEETGRLVSAEWDYLRDAQLERAFPRLIWLQRGEQRQFEVQVQGERGPRMVRALPALEVETVKAEWETALQDRHHAVMEDIAYLRPGPFFSTGADDTEAAFVGWLDAAFATFEQARAEDLLIDLRNNPGGDNSWSDPMIAWFADEPFRFASRYSLKASEHTQQVLEGLAAKEPEGISAAMAKAMAKVDEGTRFDFEIPLVTPREAGFDGRVWVLVNRHSYSNATTVAAIVQDYDFAEVIGEQTSDLPTSYASAAKLTLPATGFVVTYPKGYFVRPNGVEGVHGVKPDVVLARPNGPEDDLLERALEHIRSRAR